MQTKNWTEMSKMAQHFIAFLVIPLTLSQVSST